MVFNSKVIDEEGISRMEIFSINRKTYRLTYSSSFDDSDDGVPMVQSYFLFNRDGTMDLWKISVNESGTL